MKLLENSRKYLILLIALLLPMVSQAQFPKQREIIPLNTSLRVRSIFQDADGFVWVGKENGLERFNGLTFDPVVKCGGMTIDFRVSCSLHIKGKEWYLGTYRGLLRFNTQTRMARNIVPHIDVRSVLRLDSQHLLLATISGLLIYDERSGKYRNVPQTQKIHVIAGVRTSQGQILLATNLGLFRYNSAKGSVSANLLPSSVSTLALTEDARHGILWIGTENGVVRYSLSKGKAEQMKNITSAYVNSLALNGNSLWVGSDNGLYIYHPDTKQCESIPHDISNTWTPTDNNVTCVFHDALGNVWVGTDSGMSVVKCSSVNSYRWDLLTGDLLGNNVLALHADSRGRVWIGGTNGLALVNPGRHISVFRTAHGDKYIPNNTVRHVLEDQEHRIWIATDAGVLLYDEYTGEFFRYKVSDATKKSWASWCYYLQDDGQGNLWISTYRSGVFVVSKQKLLGSGGVCVADKNIIKGNRPFTLPDDIAKDICFDGKGNAWIVLPEIGVTKMNLRTGNSFLYAKDKGNAPLAESYALSLTKDSQGNMWIGSHHGLTRIDVKTAESMFFSDSIFGRGAVRQVLEIGNNMVGVTSNYLFVVNKKSFAVKVLRVAENINSAAIYGDVLILGGRDKLLSVSIGNFSHYNAPKTFLFTALMVDGQSVPVGEQLEGDFILPQDLNDLKKVVLPYRTKKFTYTVAVRDNESFLYSGRYAYRLKRYNDWQVLHEIPGEMEFVNVPYGSYTLEVKNIETGEVVKSQEVCIQGPWYASWWMRLIELFLFVLMAMAIFKYVRDRILRKQEEIKRQQVLALANQKMDFLMNISHDLKTPLTLIMGLVTNIRSESRNAVLRDKLDALYKHTSKLSYMVHQILDYKDEEMRKQQLHQAPLEMVEFCKSVISLFAEEALKRNIVISLITCKERIIVNVDAEKLNSILTNLLSNAIKYSPDEKNIEVKIFLRDKALVLEVKDHGVGISQEAQPLVFTRFYRTSDAEKGKAEGNGVGLAIVKQLVEIHQGKIEVESEVGQGSVFRVILPGVIMDEPVLSEKGCHLTASIDGGVVPEVAKRRSKILIVEDNVEMVQYLTSNLLEFECMVSHNGIAGFDKAVKELPDLIVSDIMMPVMDGMQLLAKLKKNVNTATIPVIMLTAKDNSDTHKKAIELGVDAFVSKPFEIGMLKARVCQLLKREGARESKIRQKAIVETVGEVKQVKSDDEKFLENINKVLEERIVDTDFGMEELSRLVGISSKQIYRRLKSLTGMTGVQYIRKMRLRKAAILLSQKRFNVSEVVYMVGFNSPSYFSKCFMEEYGMSPTQYMLQTE